MPVITFISSKGGAGKTTTAVLLGCELAEEYKVALIDADERFPLVTWSKRGPYPKKLQVIPCADERTIQDVIEEAEVWADFVLVDVKGEASQLGTFAMQCSDFVVVPAKEQVQDAHEALGTLQAVRRAGRAARRDIPSAILLTQSRASVKSRTQRAVGDELRQTVGITVLGPELVERDAFMAVFSFGGGLRQLDPKEVNGIEKAQENVEAVKAAILSLLAHTFREEGVRA